MTAKQTARTVRFTDRLDVTIRVTKHIDHNRQK